MDEEKKLSIAEDVRDFICEEKQFANELNYDFKKVGIAIDQNFVPFAFIKEQEETDVEKTDTVLFKPGTLDRIPEIEEITKLLESITPA